MFRIRHQILTGCVALFCTIGFAQHRPKDVTPEELSAHPRKYDGLLVRVRALLVFGWEGDNFLIDPSKPSPEGFPSRSPAAIWFNCKPEREQQIYGPIRPNDRRRVFGSYTGYFHFVRKPQIMNGAFSPGSLQLDAIEVSIPEPQPRLDSSTPFGLGAEGGNRVESNGRISGTLEHHPAKSDWALVKVFVLQFPNPVLNHPVMEKTLETNESAFEIGPLPPGRYLLGAYVVITLGTPDRYTFANWGWTYFPGVTDVSLAQPIELTEGNAVTGVKLKMAY
jgi:hypothetical protein